MELDSNRRSDSKAHKSVQTHSLPEEIIHEILSRLPVKSLLKFRCVCKSWRHLIATKRFAKAHLEISTKDSDFARHKLVFLDSLSPHLTLKHVSLHSLMNERRDRIEALAFDDPMYDPCDSIGLVGCCNGLICVIVDRKWLFLWNPTTRTHRRLPDVNERVKLGFVSKQGFGYDESDDDYKVFVIWSVFWVTGRYQAIGKVYSLKTNSWKLLKEKDADPFLESGKFASGKLHWGSRVGANYSWGIVSFDLKSEVYGVIEQPSYREGEFRPLLGVLGGCLCVLSDYQKKFVDIWVMKDHGVKESWVKVLTVRYPTDPWDGRLSTPFCVGSQGEVLFIYGSSFVIYYPEGSLFRRPNTVELDLFGEADVYVESLVSVVSDVEEERRVQEVV